MNAARQIIQRRLAAQLAPAQRRLASTGASENAFIRERRAVKEHAQATTGELSCL